MKVRIKQGKKMRIEMVPLIDMMFLLLVSLIYAMLSMSVHRAIPVELPYSSSAGIDKSSLISITLKKDGTLYLDKERISMEDMRKSLILLSPARKNKGLLLFADGGSSYQELFRVMDEIRQAGILKIALQAEAR